MIVFSKEVYGSYVDAIKDPRLDFRSFLFKVGVKSAQRWQIPQPTVKDAERAVLRALRIYVGSPNTPHTQQAIKYTFMNEIRKQERMTGLDLSELMSRELTFE